MGLHSSYTPAILSETNMDVGGLLAYLVGGWTNPSEKYARQIGSSSQGSG